MGRGCTTGIHHTLIIGLVTLMLLGLVGESSAYVRPGRYDLVSLSSEGQQGEYCRPQDVPTQFCPESPSANSAFASSLSSNGRFVAFASAAGGLVPGDQNGHSDIFVRDRRSGQTNIASVSSLGVVAAGHAGGGVDQVSVGPKFYGSHGGAWMMALSYDPSISANGRYVAFTSAAANLVPGDTNAAVDVFVHDLHSGNTERVSVNSEGVEGFLDLTTVRPEALAHGSAVGDSFYPSISANGRYVSFSSFASNLAEEKDTNGWIDVFVHDRDTGRTERVSVTSEGGEAEMYVCLSQLVSCKPWTPRSSLSPNGRWVVYDSVASDHVAGDTNEIPDVFLHDRKNRKNERISLGSNGEEPMESTPQIGWSGAGSSLSGASPFYTAGRSISADGRFVTFVSRAENLIPSDNNRDPRFTGAWYAGQDVFVRDRRTDRTRRVSVTSVGHETDVIQKNAPVVGSVGYQYPSISADGRFVTFQGYGLVSGKFKETIGIYVHDVHTGATEFISRMFSKHDGETRTSSSEVPDISADGRYVSYASTGWPEGRKDDDRTGGMDFFVRDRGQVVGSDTSTGHSGEGEDDEPLICIEGVCLPPGGVAQISAREGTTVPRDSILRSDQVLGASVAYRPGLADLFLRVEVDRLPGIRAGSDLVPDGSSSYVVRFRRGDKRYELKAMPLAGRTAIRLFECDRACVGIAWLEGAYGSTGEEVVASLPLGILGLSYGGTISEIEISGGPFGRPHS